MKSFIFLFVVLTQVVLADTFTYQSYYDQEKTEELDLKVVLELTGKFNKKSKVVSMKIFGRKDVLLFNIPGKNFDATWDKDGLKLSVINMVKPLIKSKYMPTNSDTLYIFPGHEHNIENLLLNEEGTLDCDDEGFMLADMDMGEMAAMGFLGKK